MPGADLPPLLALLMALVGALGLAEAWAEAGRRGPDGGALARDRAAWASLAFALLLLSVPWSAASPVALGLGLAASAALAILLPRVMIPARATQTGAEEVLWPSARPALGLAVLLGAAKVWGLLVGLGLVVLAGMPAAPADAAVVSQIFLGMRAMGLLVSWSFVMWPVWRGDWAGGRAGLRVLCRGGILTAAMAGWMLLSLLQGLVMGRAL